VSPDGSHAVASVDLGTWNIQVRDLRSGASTNIAMQGTVAGDPVFASDGRSAFFVTNNGQTGEIYRVATSDASAPRTLVVRDTALSLAEPSPSPDGRTLYYVRARGGRSDIMKHSLDQPSSADRPAIDAPARERSPSVSPNGRWLAYASDESGHFEIYVRSTDSSRADRWQISAGGGAIPRWSSDGRELFFIAHDSLLSAEATTDREFTVRSRHALFSLARFIVGRGGYDVLPGGAGFLMLERRESRSPTPRIVFVDQWKGLLAASRR
jgi:Tol biopolymer transport system component